MCGPIQVQCAVCGKICNGRKNHTDHMRIHNRPAIYPCDLCDKKFRTGEIYVNSKLNVFFIISFTEY